LPNLKTTAYNGHMRVLMVSKALVVGAYQRKAEEIAACGVDLTVLIPPYWRDSRGHQAAEARHVGNYRLQITPVRFNGRFHFHYYPGIAHELATVQPDLIHMDEEPYNFATWHALRAAARQEIPGTFFAWQNLGRRYPPPFRWMEQANYRRTPIAIAGNLDACTVLRGKGYAGEVAVIPQFGVDPVTFSPQRQQPVAAPPLPKQPDASSCPSPSPKAKPFVIGYAGGLLPEKGLDSLLQACARLDTSWQLLLAGEGNEQTRLEQLASELGIVPCVSFVGRVPSHEMADFYRQLDAFVLPSRSTASWQEQFGRVLIEAMACAVPVVGSDSGEIPNVIGDAGLVFPEDNVAAMAQQLQRLSDEPALRGQMARAGRERVLTHYTMRSVAERTVEVYERLCALA
jgi:glycosyltransferase involved in cell wall biosynthesis